MMEFDNTILLQLFSYYVGIRKTTCPSVLARLMKFLERWKLGDSIHPRVHTYFTASVSSWAITTFRFIRSKI